MSEPLVGLVGYAQAGKDTFAKYLVKYLGYYRIAFADALKDVALDCHRELDHMVTEFGWEWVKANVNYARPFLQDLGIAVREHIDRDAWVTAAFKDWSYYQAAVFTDVRFPNEIKAIRDRGGIIVRIDREGNKPANSHISEFAWQDCEPDYQYTFGDGQFALMEEVARQLDRNIRGYA